MNTLLQTDSEPLAGLQRLKMKCLGMLTDGFRQGMLTFAMEPLLAPYWSTAS